MSRLCKSIGHYYLFNRKALSLAKLWLRVTKQTETRLSGKQCVKHNKYPSFDEKPKKILRNREND